MQTTNKMHLYYYNEVNNYAFMHIINISEELYERKYCFNDERARCNIGHFHKRISLIKLRALIFETNSFKSDFTLRYKSLSFRIELIQFPAPPPLILLRIYRRLFSSVRDAIIALAIVALFHDYKQ